MTAPTATLIAPSPTQATVPSTHLTALVRSTPGGPLALLLDGDVVVAAGFTSDPASLQARVEPQLRQRALVTPRPGAGGADGVASVGRALDRWLDGDPAALDGVSTRQPATAFRRAVWAALSAIPAGTTASYGSIATALGNPRATRAVGTACGANLLAPFVPCHRAVRADGSLGGYAYGLHVKRWLLDHERRHAARPGGHEG